MLRMVLRLATFTLLGLLAACSGASWQNIRVPPSYQAPKEMRIAVVNATNSYHSPEATQAVADALSDCLRREGIKVTIVPAPTGIEPLVSVVQWNQGQRALRWLTLGGGRATIVVVLQTPLNAPAGVTGTAHGYLSGGWFGGDSLTAAEEAGELIGKALATGKAE